jgi:dolichol kinase
MDRLGLPRRAFHFSGIVVPIVYLAAGKQWALGLAGLLLCLAVLIEVLRLRGYFRSTFIGRHLKEKEQHGLSGSTYFLFSCVLTMLLFEKQVAAAAMVVLAIADPLASIIGSRWGKIRLLGKSAEGTTAFLVSSLIILICFGFRPAAAASAALAAAAAELVSPAWLDDNITIPLVTAVVLWATG